MKSRVVQTVYNLPFIEFQTALVTEVPYKGEITISPSLLGGWSSLNFLGLVDGIPKFIIKLPSKLDGSDFKKLYSIHDTLSQYGISSKPLGIGEIEYEPKIPYLLLEFEEGVIYSDPKDIRRRHFIQLQDTLKKLNQIDVPNSRRYAESTEYVNALMSSLKRKHAQWKGQLDQKLRVLFDQFISDVEEVNSRISEMDWNPVTIHGDLYERNIVFQDNRVILLDLEECCVADRFFDLAYLFTQSYTTSRIEKNRIAKIGVHKEHWQNLELIALISVISWSFKWLFDIAFEDVEPNLLASVGIPTVVDYVETKMRFLSSILL